MLDLIGLGTAGLQDRQEIPDDALLHYVALLGQQSRSPAALQAILRDYFGVPAEIEQFAGAWYRLDLDSQCRMEDEGSESQELGKGAVVGDEIWDQQSRVRIRLGPLTLSQYCDFLPDGSAFEPLKAMTDFSRMMSLILKCSSLEAGGSSSLEIGMDQAGSLPLWLGLHG